MWWKRYTLFDVVLINLLGSDRFQEENPRIPRV